MYDRRYLSKVINSRIIDLDKELKTLINTGIYFMPELAIAFELGKSIFNERKNIFGTEKNEWLREQKLGDSGINDIVFKKETGELFVFELKLADKKDKYEKDILKLKTLDANTTKIFCALVDTYSKDRLNDPRIKYIIKSYGDSLHEICNSDYWFPNPVRDERIEEEIFLTFNTWQPRYTSDIDCAVCIWEVDSNAYLVFEAYHEEKHISVEIIKKDELFYILFRKKQYGFPTLDDEIIQFEFFDKAFDHFIKRVEKKYAVKWTSFYLVGVYEDYENIIRRNIENQEWDIDNHIIKNTKND